MGVVSVFLMKGVALLLLMEPLMVLGEGGRYDTSAVEGVVYCKPCEHHGVATLLGASPSTGAGVRLECKNIKYPQTLSATTDKNGYFFLHPLKNVSITEFSGCRVFLVYSPKGSSCYRVTDLNNGQSGAVLSYRTSHFPKESNFLLFDVGPFAFEPSTCTR